MIFYKKDYLKNYNLAKSKRAPITDSAQSAVTIKELISKCLTEVEAGNHIVESTKQAIDKVLVNMDSFANIASSSAQASKEQVEMLKEVEFFRKGIRKGLLLG